MRRKWIRRRDSRLYEGPSEGLEPRQWKLKSPKSILDLKVCDMAMGSGAFLVQACRYLAERLVEAWENLEKQHPGEVLTTPDGTFSTGSPSERVVPSDTNERVAIARRVVADRCLYGVDINPMAVKMAKLSLWLVTLQRDRPFTFLDHALKSGDSLLGASSIKQIESFSLLPGERQVTFATANLSQYVEEASVKRRALEDLPSNDHTHIETKIRLHVEAEAATAKVKVLADALIAFELHGFDGERYEEKRAFAADQAKSMLQEISNQEQEKGRRLTQSEITAVTSSFITYSSSFPRRPFHWPVELPEVFARGGFDAVVGNPPFMGGTKLEPAFGREWREFLVNHLAAGIRGVRGTADLCAYFFLRATQVLGPTGCCGLIATNSIAEGDTLLVGLDKLTKAEVRITRAVSSMTWPGGAAIFVAVVWLRKGDWKGIYVLDNAEVPAISSALRVPGKLNVRPKRLLSNAGRVIEGAKALGMGFILDKAEARSLIKLDPTNRDVLFPFLTGQDLNSRPDQTPSRCTIYFFDWPLNRESAPEGYNGPVAADYPSCLNIIEQRVKAERLSYPPDSSWNRSLRDRWWLYGLPRPALLHAMKGKTRVLVRSAVSNFNCFAFCDTHWVFSHATKVFIFDDFGSFAFFQSEIHTLWLEEYSSRMKSDIRYTPETCFDTLPLLDLPTSLSPLGERYYEQRRQIMLSRQEGLTTTYKRFRDRGEKSEDIARLRALQVEMDQSIAAAYGWSNLDLGHDFHETRQGMRFTIRESARRAVLDRLLALNHQRFDEEAAAKIAQAVSAPVKPSRKIKRQCRQIDLRLAVMRRSR
jgi:hypothetical protein